VTSTRKAATRIRSKRRAPRSSITDFLWRAALRLPRRGHNDAKLLASRLVTKFSAFELDA
jgi:hypothetical protein